MYKYTCKFMGKCTRKHPVARLSLICRSTPPTPNATSDAHAQNRHPGCRVNTISTRCCSAPRPTPISSRCARTPPPSVSQCPPVLHQAQLWPMHGEGVQGRREKQENKRGREKQQKFGKLASVLGFALKGTSHAQKAVSNPFFDIQNQCKKQSRSSHP